MNKGSIVCGVAAALIGSGLIWAVGSKEDTGIAGWETLNVSMEQAIGIADAEASVTEGDQGSQQVTGKKQTSKKDNVQAGQDTKAGKAPTGADQNATAIVDGTEAKESSETIASGTTTVAAVDGVQVGDPAVPNGQGSVNNTSIGRISGSAPDSPVSAESVGQAVEQDGKVNVNIASSAELMELPGIGEKKAQAIIDYRNSVGSFRNLSDLGKVKGIGTKMLEKLKPLVAF